MEALEQLYQEIILDHYKFPRNKADLSHLPDDQLYENPSCGDTVKLELQFDSEGRIASARFDGHGCAISTASASLMSERLTGKTPEEAHALMEIFIQVMRGELSADRLEQWGDLAALGGVAQFPLRVKCATLPWHALKEQLENVREY